MALIIKNDQYTGHADGIRFDLDKMNKYVTFTFAEDRRPSPQKLSGIARQLFGESTTKARENISRDYLDRPMIHAKYVRTQYTS